MREIKFRGKRVDNGEWVYGHYFIEERDIEDGIIWRDIPQIQQRYGDHFQYFDVDPDTVGQYTGLKDKHGKEIYEGDIVRHNYRFGNGKGIVCYSAPNLELKRLNKNGACNDFTWDEWELFEIIGNIHDNPELLGESYHEN